MMTSGLRRFVHRVLSLVRSGRAESELSREIDAHLRLLEEGFLARGMSPDDARRAARRAFGGVEQAKEHQRDARSFRWLAGWPMDLRLGVRMLAKTPGLTAVAVVALAVAIGAGAAYLEFTRDLLRPTLPGPHGDRIVGVRLQDVQRNQTQPRNLADLPVWRANARTLEHLGAARPIDPHLVTDDGRTEPARAAEVSASAFRLLDTPPMLGRPLTDDDERASAPPVVVIGHDLWQKRFNADPNVVGRDVRVGPTVRTIVGVMPEGFAFPINQNLWMPLKVPPAGLSRGEGPDIQVFGRLKEGVTMEAASAELQGLMHDPQPELRAEVVPFLDRLTDDARGIALVHAANLLFVLLLAICGANVATLVFARTATREAEITVRTALGATRSRITAQLFAEALVLSVVAAAVGLAIAAFASQWGKRLFTDAFGPAPFWWNDGLSVQTMLYALALAVLAALIVGIVPALKATGRHLQGRLREAGAGTSTMKLGWLWTGIIATQAALTVIFLATVASLGWTSFRGQQGLDVTYPRGEMLTALVSAEPDAAGSPVAVDARSLQAVVTRLGDEPGVIHATYTTAVPGTIWEQFVIEFPPTEAGRALAADADRRKQTDVLWSESARVGLNFFETVGTRLVAGRLFTAAEVLGGHDVAVVDETFVRTVLGGRNPLGVQLRQRAPVDGTPGPWLEIVGVVRDITVMERKTADDAAIYRPAGTGASPMRLLVRTDGPAAPMSDRIQAAVLSAAPSLRLRGAMSLDRVAEADALPTRVFLRIFAVLSIIALLLATAGIYALVSFTLARRTREIGIRIALGAGPRRVITGVFSRAFTQVGLGVLAGTLPGTVILAFGAEDSGRIGVAAGAGIMIAIACFVVLVATASCSVPLRRALRIEPTEALRLDT